MNRLLVDAQLVARGALRHTPAGLPVYDMSLKHESQVQQEGTPRTVALELRARAIGAMAERVASLELGSMHGFAGFLGAARNGRGIVFHVTELAD